LLGNATGGCRGKKLCGDSTRTVRVAQEQRAKLALALVESLEPEDEGDIAEAWRVEAERRYEQFKRGEVQAIPGDEVFARIRSRLRSG
jgi:putative addiction module component (TIGR02574 family)